MNMQVKHMTDLAWTFGSELEERIERLEPALYLAALTLALLLRLLNLGAAPLGEDEAGWALQALQVARPEQTAAVQVGPNPAYITLTGLSFALFGATDFLARAWPALSGALLVAGVYLLRGDLGRLPSLALALGLAIDPALVTVSRQAGGSMPAVTFTVLALGLWRQGRPWLAGIAGGFALLGGPSIVPGVAALALAVWASTVAGRKLAQRYASDLASGEPATTWEAGQVEAAPAAPPDHRRAALTAAAITLVLVGSALLRLPQGLPAFFGQLTSYFQGWVQPTGAGLPVLLLALAAYELLPLVFALIHVGRAAFAWETWDDKDILLVVFGGTWAAAALLLMLIYPARQASDLVWVIVPLWMLAAREAARYVPDKRQHPMAWMQALMLLVLAALFWITLTTTPALVQPDMPWEPLRLVILAGIFVLAVLTSALVALGWNWPISRDGSAWGGLTVLLVYSISVLWGASQLRSNQPQELWSQSPGPAQARLLADTLHDLSIWGRGMSNEIEIVSSVDLPSLRWVLRDYQHARFNGLPGTGLSAAERPAIVITSAQDETPELAAEYRGQDFAWGVLPGWEGALPADLKEWITYRRSPVLYDHIILWGRSDLFPGAEAAQ